MLVHQFNDIELAEDGLQALDHWIANGVPDNPRAWIIVAAKRKALDRLRREDTRQQKAEAVKWQMELDQLMSNSSLEEFPDHRLGLIFTCCHPALAQPARVALTFQIQAAIIAVHVQATDFHQTDWQ